MRPIAAAVTGALLFCASLLAQNNRSAVSLTGNDTASCTVPDPCRTFDVAISKSNAGGEVIVLSSAGYGPFTVTKSISIISPPAYHAALAPTSGNAITINADNALVVLRGLTLNGSLGGQNGILFTGQIASPSGTTLSVENCVIGGFSGNGISFVRNGILFVTNLIARQNVYDAVYVDGSPGNPSWASIDHALLEKSLNAALEVQNASVAIRDSIAAAGYVGFWALAIGPASTADVSVENCQATHNTYGYIAGNGGGTAQLIVSDSVAWANGYGLFADDNGTVRASNNRVSRNSIGLWQLGAGVFRSRGNNTVDGNSTATSGTITTFGPM